MTERMPDTRASLMLRLKDVQDQAAWREFERIYRPAVYRLARRRGLQPVDADDVSQQVLFAVSEKMPAWEIGAEAGSFRAWLLIVTRNVVAKELRRRQRKSSREDGRGQELLAEVALPDEVGDELLHEVQRSLFRWAADEVRVEFQPTTWQAFWRTAVEQQPLPSVAKQLSMSIGSLYTARSRVLKRIREKANETDWGDIQE